jgi:hypothetical protein
MSFVKKTEENCWFRTASETTARERTEKKTEKADFASRKTFEKQKIVWVWDKTLPQPTTLCPPSYLLHFSMGYHSVRTCQVLTLVRALKSPTLNRAKHATLRWERVQPCISVQ